jgi:hypothetical protein
VQHTLVIFITTFHHEIRHEQCILFPATFFSQSRAFASHISHLLSPSQTLLFSVLHLHAPPTSHTIAGAGALGAAGLGFCLLFVRNAVWVLLLWAT